MVSLEGGPLGRLGGSARIGRYVVLGSVGEGGMGWVLAAYDPELDRKVAIKVLRPRAVALDSQGHADLEARLVREARAIARLSHPNVVAIHDVGTHEGQIFLAMEFLRGGTLRRWMATPRPLAAICDVFLQVGRGLAAAHAQGLVHRDFKPENVLFDQRGCPKVVDFGLVRLLSRDERPATLELPAAGAAGSALLSHDESAVLTVTGALAGTPAYMAPEQLLGRPVDARADQFAFAAALFEAVCGRRPFSGSSPLQLAAAMAGGASPEFPKDAPAPAWLRRALVKALAEAPADRHRSMEALLELLANDPGVSLRRRLRAGAGGAVAALAIGLSLAYGISRHRRFEATLGSRRAEARLRLDEAHAAEARLRSTRARAFQLFDEGQRREAEALWPEALAAAQKTRQTFERAAQLAEGAFLLDTSRDDARALLADSLRDRALFEREQSGRVDESVSDRLALYDRDGRRQAQLSAPATVEASAEPAGARVTIEIFGRAEGETGRYDVVSRDAPLPLPKTTLAPGSYRLTFSAPGRATVVIPLVLAAGGGQRVATRLPPERALPDDFVLISGGELWIGSAEPEEIRRELQAAVPMHRRRQGSFLIKRHETTYREWIAYLEDSPAAERERRTPKAAAMGFQGSVALRARGSGWELSLQPSTRAFVVESGQRLRNPARPRRQEQDWMELPVSGVSADDAAAYATWLSRSGRVPGARLCADEEWEHAARGADGRPFPHGFRLQPGDANFATTWDHDPRAFGPDVVGSYPQSRSPYGVDDLAGNVWEWVSSRDRTSEGQQVARGGGFAFDELACRTEVREVSERLLRNITAGVRVCADWAESK
jgi:formylglycine-generating enzyme required for sulfatase activity